MIDYQSIASRLRGIAEELLQATPSAELQEPARKLLEMASEIEQDQLPRASRIQGHGTD
jgi:hypothetical protein